MPKQRMTFTRTESITFEFDYKVDPHTKANAEFWINQGYCGGSPLGKPGTEIPLAIMLSEWKLSRSDPSVLPVAEPLPASTPSRKVKVTPIGRRA